MDEIVICRQCRKEIKTDAYKCMTCIKNFHPSCHKLHKVYNSANELVPCGGKVEAITVKSRNENGRPSTTEERQTSGAAMDSKINDIYKLLADMRYEISRDYIKQVITEVISEELSKIRMELQQWKMTEMETLINQAVKREVKNAIKEATMLKETGETIKNTYSQAVKNQGGSW